MTSLRPPRPAPRLRRGRAGVRAGRRDRGSAALELAILVPAMLLLIGFMVLAGRVAAANNAVTSIAGNAAREASLARDASAASAAASSAARAALADQDLHCVGGAQVSVDPSGFAAAAAGLPGQSVVVTVSCLVNLADLAIPGVPGSRTVSDQGVSPIDVNRGAANTGAGP